MTRFITQHGISRVAVIVADSEEEFRQRAKAAGFDTRCEALISDVPPGTDLEGFPVGRMLTPAEAEAFVAKAMRAMAGGKAQ